MAKNRVTQSEENVPDVPGDSRDNQLTSEYHEDESSTCKPVRKPKSARSAGQRQDHGFKFIGRGRGKPLSLK